MTGGLMQLVAYGAQDVYLTGNPQITFFKVVYRRHTNFSMESIEQTFNGTADFGKRVTCTVSRNADLIHRVYLQVTLPSVESTMSSQYFRWVNYIGHVLIKQVEVEIGGQRIDKHYGDWLTIWNELTIAPGIKDGYDNMVGNTIALTGTGLQSTDATSSMSHFNSGSAETQVFLFHLLLFNTTKLNSTLNSDQRTNATSPLQSKLLAALLLTA